MFRVGPGPGGNSQIIGCDLTPLAASDTSPFPRSKSGVFIVGHGGVVVKTLDPQ